MGHACFKMGDLSKALFYCEKCLIIAQKILPLYDAELATQYQNIGRVYENKGGSSVAYELYTQAFEIHRKILPANYPTLAYTFNRTVIIGRILYQQSKYLSSLHEEQLKLRLDQTSAVTDQTGFPYDDSMGDSPETYSISEHVFTIEQFSPAANYPHISVMP